MRALEVTPAEANRPPTDAWLKQVLSVGSNLSWTDVEHASIDAAKIAAQGNRTSAMGRWLQVAQWARLLSSDQRQVTNRWVTAMNSARLGHANWSGLRELSH